MIPDRIERALEQLAENSSDTRSAVAALHARFSVVERLQDHVDALDAAMRSHTHADARALAKIDTDLRRLWWGVGAVITAVVGVIVSTLAKAAGT